jgi:hypothetical protein
VSTILYLIALQEVTVTPFRVVDEINQVGGGATDQEESRVTCGMVGEDGWGGGGRLLTMGIRVPC